MPASDLLYTTTQTHEDFPWPGLVERRERPAQPPLRTGVRLFCPGFTKSDVTARVCKHEEDCVVWRSDENTEIEKKKEVDDDGDVLMNRKDAMAMNREDMERLERKRNEGWLKSIYQRDYVLNDMSYDDLMEQANKASKDSLKRRCRGGKYYLDPIPFKKKNDKKPLIG